MRAKTHFVGQVVASDGAAIVDRAATVDGPQRMVQQSRSGGAVVGEWMIDNRYEGELRDDVPWSELEAVAKVCRDACMCMANACMHACMNVFMYVCMYVYMDGWMQKSSSEFMFVMNILGSGGSEYHYHMSKCVTHRCRW